jgi:hypothetical protein
MFLKNGMNLMQTNQNIDKEVDNRLMFDFWKAFEHLNVKQQELVEQMRKRLSNGSQQLTLDCFLKKE